MHGWMTSRHEGCVSTMLTDKRLKYSTVVAPLQGSMQRNGGCKTESTALRGAFRLALPFSAAPALEVAHRQCNTLVAFGEHRAHTAFMSAGHPVMHEVQYLGIGVALVTRP